LGFSSYSGQSQKAASVIRALSAANARSGAIHLQGLDRTFPSARSPQPHIWQGSAPRRSGETGCTCNFYSITTNQAVIINLFGIATSAARTDRQAAALFLIAPMSAVSMAPPAPPATACEITPPTLRLSDWAAAKTDGSISVTTWPRTPPPTGPEMMLPAVPDQTLAMTCLRQRRQALLQQVLLKSVPFRSPYDLH
jgi:hypothetical protein